MIIQRLDSFRRIDARLFLSRPPQIRRQRCLGQSSTLRNIVHFLDLHIAQSSATWICSANATGLDELFTDPAAALSVITACDSPSPETIRSIHNFLHEWMAHHILGAKVSELNTGNTRQTSRTFIRPELSPRGRSI